MAGTTDTWRVAYMSALPGKLYRGVAIPSAGAVISLHTDGTPDATANPNAVHLGGTKAGAKVMIKPKYDNFSIDEFRAPVITNVGGVEMAISAELAAVNDTNLLAWALPGVGTRSTTASTSEQIKIGAKDIAYDSVCLIFPLKEDPTKFGWFHIYSGINMEGVSWGITRTEPGFTPINFLGFEVTTRAVGDTVGCVGKQSASPIAAWT